MPLEPRFLDIIWRLCDCSGHLMPLYLANGNDPRFRIDTEEIQKIGNVQLVEFIVESIILEQELT